MAAGACGLILATLATAQTNPNAKPTDGAAASGKAAATEAPTGFDNLSNGFQEKKEFKKARKTFKE